MHLNGYKIMWLYVFFDLPTNTKKERKAAQKFRKDLLRDGFTMAQYSVYKRYSPSPQKADVHERRVKLFLPRHGHVSILRITDKQFGKIQNFWGTRSLESEGSPAQLQFF